MHFGKTWYGLLMVIGFRYFLIAGVAYFLWYKLWRSKLAYKKIQSRFPAGKDYQREIGYSIITIFIFTAVPASVLQTPLRRFTQYYSDLHSYSRGWFWLAFPFMFIVHDTYFYWMHRLIHHPSLFNPH